ncbi:MAG: methylenetetrahydrofolate reductase, partial [Oscillospiraceae bacterium]
GAGGSNNRNSTVAIASKLKNQYHFEPLAHLVCINSTKQSVQEILKELKANNIENIMALRGDKNPEIENISDFQYASDLIKLINQYGGFNLSAACYPEGHNEASSLQADIDNLKNKVDCGVSNLITQLFFDNESFYEFSDLAAQKGINIPISTGIMPCLNKNQILRMVSMCGVSLPKKFTKIINKYENDPQSLYEAGIYYATDQIIEMISSGVRGVHLYTMNKPDVAQRILQNIKSISESVNNSN